jgi:hypothetical protein
LGPQDKERRAGFAFLEDVLAVVVVALVDDAGETPEVPATKVFEEGHLFEEVHQAAAFLGHRRFRRRSEQRPCWSCRRVQQVRVRGPREQEFLDPREIEPQWNDIGLLRHDILLVFFIRAFVMESLAWRHWD